MLSIEFIELYFLNTFPTLTSLSTLALPNPFTLFILPTHSPLPYPLHSTNTQPGLLLRPRNKRITRQPPHIVCSSQPVPSSHLPPVRNNYNNAHLNDLNHDEEDELDEEVILFLLICAHTII